MEQLLRKSAVRLTGCALDKLEECPISGEYTLPEYCPDVAVVLKCFAYPRIQNRQWSGEQLLLDGNAMIRVLYLDEDRRCVHSLEFVQPFSCTLRGDSRVDNASVEWELGTKYMNCRAVSARRVEVRGVVAVRAYADCAENKSLVAAVEDRDLYTRTVKTIITVPNGSCDKIVSVSEALEFDQSLPPAEMLLGGECRAVIRECKLLTGKAIVKGQVYIHQLYMDNTAGNHTHCLDYTLPFSQIMDVDMAREGMPYKAAVQVLSDTERCSVGPDGENTILEVNVKLLVQVQVYDQQEIDLLKDVYHCRYPVSAQTEDVNLCTLLNTRWENTTLPISLSLPVGKWSEIVDLFVQPQQPVAECCEGKAGIKGRLLVCVLARDADGEVVYDEFVEEYALEDACNGNVLRMDPTVTTVQYRMTEEKLEMSVQLCMRMTEYNCYTQTIVSDLRLQEEAPYPQQKVTALLYYADGGETVWDIGRACHASPDCILKENALESEDIKESTVIVVPIIN